MMLPKLFCCCKSDKSITGQRKEVYWIEINLSVLNESLDSTQWQWESAQKPVGLGFTRQVLTETESGSPLAED